MFDLDLIEQDWKNNSFRLSEEEIIEIYRSEGITLKEYENQINQYREKIHGCSKNLTAEERLIRSIFYHEEELKEIEEIQNKIKEVPQPEKRHLSEESQNKVVEGCLYMVFDNTHDWYKFFKGKISLEIIYYICLDSLMNCVKYMLHSEKPVFRLYVGKSIEQNIIKYISKRTHISYREAYKKINNIHYGPFFDENKPLSDFYEDLNNLAEIKEEPEKPSKIFYQLKDEQYDIDYTENISCMEFMKDYQQVLDSLDDISREVMELSFTSDGDRGFTSKEIGDFLGISSSKVLKIKRKSLQKIGDDEKIKTYL